MTSTKKYTALKPSGYMITTSLDDDSIIEADTLQCVHCGCHFKIEPGSGKKRGYCHTCNGPICSEKCAKCVPMEQQLENMENGRPIDFKPIIVVTSI